AVLWTFPRATRPLFRTPRKSRTPSSLSSRIFPHESVRPPPDPSRLRPRRKILYAQRGLAAQDRGTPDRTPGIFLRQARPRARRRLRPRPRQHAFAQAFPCGASDRTRSRPADAATRAARLAASALARVRRRECTAAAGCERRRAVFQPVHPVDRRSAGAVRRIPPRAAAGRLPRVFHVRAGHPARIAQRL